jgi:peptidoglycan/LPS O-acetylase OafA/YrhL
VTFYLVLPLLAALVLPRRRTAQGPWRPARTAALIAAITIPVTPAWLVCVNASPLTGPLGLETITAPQLAFKLIVHAGIAVTALTPLIFGPQTGLKSAMGSAPMRWLGHSTSYGLYLWHPFVLQMVMKAYGLQLLWGYFHVAFPLTLAGGLALATLSYYVVERPVMKLANRFPKGRGPSAVESQSRTRPVTATA